MINYDSGSIPTIETWPSNLKIILMLSAVGFWTVDLVRSLDDPTVLIESDAKLEIYREVIGRYQTTSDCTQEIQQLNLTEWLINNGTILMQKGKRSIW